MKIHFNKYRRNGVAMLDSERRRREEQNGRKRE
jgi:hypothetical protein